MQQNDSLGDGNGGKGKATTTRLVPAAAAAFIRLYTVRVHASNQPDATGTVRSALSHCSTPDTPMPPRMVRPCARERGGFALR